MKPIRQLAGFTGFALLIASGWCSTASAQGPSAKSPSRLIEAGCGYSPAEAPAAPARPQQNAGETQGKFRHASRVLVSSHGRDWDDDSDHAGIVGLWKVKFVSKDNTGIPDGT